MSFQTDVFDPFWLSEVTLFCCSGFTTFGCMFAYSTIGTLSLFLKYTLWNEEINLEKTRSRAERDSRLIQNTRNNSFLCEIVLIQPHQWIELSSHTHTHIEIANEPLLLSRLILQLWNYIFIHFHY